MEKPLVSIIVCCFNHSKFVKQLLDSIKAQTYNNIQLILSDDASSDNSVEVYEAWLKENNYQAVKNFHKTNTGLATILNEGLDLVKGKYMKFISADDYLHPNAIEKCVNKLEELGNDYGIYYGEIQIIDENNQEVLDRDGIKFPPDYVPINGNCFAECIQKFPFWAQTVLYRFDILKQTNFKFNKDFFSEDWNIIIHISRYAKIAGETSVFAYYRILSTSVTIQNWNEKNLHKIYFSWFDMIFTFLNHPKNTKEENAIIEIKLLSILNDINCYNYKLKIKLLNKYFKLLFSANNKAPILKSVPSILRKLK
jgi:glycosyltransferase involved in cell wall biosynthesis